VMLYLRLNKVIVLDKSAEGWSPLSTIFKQVTIDLLTIFIARYLLYQTIFL
jgi:hypothetical protein